ncbi:hypothetical protein KIH86_02200 [Paenibacillus sp. HN-1]|uniref:hypothetical protein n=1 Tax=Paenibacillus TaxID=44249 RepID=UPI001CA99D1A|nr:MULTISPECIES: hypothetical protein [Paenibacillus]MBY9080298.1 hypothetical protein [Paenibacillus sp. CGMCC 1.18879]MBY9083043.1 hypothetical protein [Paenibacillus sinensis]
MGWSSLRVIPNIYNEEIEAIDEALLDLIHKRRETANGRRMAPDMEKLEQLSAKYGIELPELSMLIHGFNDQVRPVFWEESSELTGVLSIMKKTVSGDCEYMLTHAMQYEDYSRVALDIRYLPESRQDVMLRPQLTLAVIGEGQYTVNPQGGRGGGGRSKMEFVVVPRLPDNLENIEFSLVPHAMHMEQTSKEIKLDKQVDF